jgi:hypothetical protein
MISTLTMHELHHTGYKTRHQYKYNQYKQGNSTQSVETLYLPLYGH